MRYSTLLVPLDGSSVAEQIIPYARMLAETCKMRVDLLGVIDSADGAASSREYLQKIAAAHFPKTQPGIVEKRGDAANAILEHAKSLPDVMIGMATHGRSGIQRWMLGSVANKIVQAGVAPVFLIRAKQQSESSADGRLTSVIVPLDGSEFGESVLPAVTDLAQCIKLEIVLARAYELPPKAYYRTDDFSEAQKRFVPSYDEVVAEASREPRLYLEKSSEEVRRAGAERVRTVLLQGEAADEILKLSNASAGSFLAMCTHGISGVKSWLLGSVTDKVVHHSDVPVLIVPAARP